MGLVCSRSILDCRADIVKKYGPIQVRITEITELQNQEGHKNNRDTKAGECPYSISPSQERSRAVVSPLLRDQT